MDERVAEKVNGEEEKEGSVIIVRVDGMSELRVSAAPIADDDDDASAALLYLFSLPFFLCRTSSSFVSLLFIPTDSLHVAASYFFPPFSSSYSDMDIQRLKQ